MCVNLVIKLFDKKKIKAIEIERISMSIKDNTEQ